MDSLDNFLKGQPPTALRPLLGQTILVVEDSRFASEAIRMVAIRSGARIRRADGLASARRHLAAYRPTVMLVDIGLPDGSGLELIREHSDSDQRVTVLLASSGDDSHEEAALAAGADGFLAKPVASLAKFQVAVLERLPREARPVGLRAVLDDIIDPDSIAYQDDLAHAQEALLAGEVAYVAQFMQSLAFCVNDRLLEKQAQACAWAPEDAAEVAKLDAMIASRLGQQVAV